MIWHLKNIKKDTIKFDEENCITKMLDYILKLECEPKKVKNKVLEHEIQMHADNGSGFDTCIILKNLSCDRRIVDLIRTGKGLISLKVFNGKVGSKPQNLFFKFGMTHLKFSPSKLGKTLKLQKELLKTEMKHEEIFADTWKKKLSAGIM